jgi:hypothetical protein
MYCGLQFGNKVNRNQTIMEERKGWVCLIASFGGDWLDLRGRK